MTRTFNPEDKLTRIGDISSIEFDQETMLMSIDAGAYYGLEGPARTIWMKLATPLTFSALVDELVAEYRVPSSQCAAEVKGFLEDMEREGLLHVG